MKITVEIFRNMLNIGVTIKVNPEGACARQKDG